MTRGEANRPVETGDSEALDVLLERSLRGDEEAARLLVTLLQTKHYKDIFTGLRKSQLAHTQTVEDVIQDSIISLLDRLRAGELADLAPEARRDFLTYFKGVLTGNLRNAVRERQSPVLARSKAPLHEEILDKNALVPGSSGNTEHLSLVRQAVTNLDPESAKLLRMYLDGMTYPEISRATGRKEELLRNDVHRIKQALQMDIIPKSATAQLHRETQERRGKSWPSRAEIEGAIASLPPTIKEAVVRVHLERQPVEAFAATLGDRGGEKAASRLKQAYRTLSFKLKVPFPEAFEKASP